LLSRPSGVASESPGNGASVKPEPLDVCSGLRMLQQPSIDEHATPILYGVKSIKVLKPKMHVQSCSRLVAHHHALMAHHQAHHVFLNGTKMRCITRRITWVFSMAPKMHVSDRKVVESQVESRSHGISGERFTTYSVVITGLSRNKW